LRQSLLDGDLQGREGFASSRSGGANVRRSDERCRELTIGGLNENRKRHDDLLP
jgi:hypothetical protein